MFYIKQTNESAFKIEKIKTEIRKGLMVGCNIVGRENIRKAYTLDSVLNEFIKKVCNVPAYILNLPSLKFYEEKYLSDLIKEISTD